MLLVHNEHIQNTTAKAHSHAAAPVEALVQEVDLAGGHGPVAQRLHHQLPEGFAVNALAAALLQRPRDLVDVLDVLHQQHPANRSGTRHSNLHK
jgi:hypothetical protein